MSASNEKNNRYLLTDWKPENPAFWENKGKHIARRNPLDISKLSVAGVLRLDVV